MTLAPRTLAGRIFVTFAAILAVVMLLSIMYVKRTLRDDYRRDVENRLHVAAKLLSHEAIRAFGQTDAAETVTGIVDDLRRTLEEENLRLTLIAPDGEVRFDSVAPAPLVNHADRPEIVEARTSGRGGAVRRSATTSTETLYYALRLDVDSKIVGFVRVASDLATVERGFSLLTGDLLFGSIAVLVLGLLGTALVSRLLARPLETIQEHADALSRGDLESHVPEITGPVEVRRLAASLHRMGDDLRDRIGVMERNHHETEAIHASMSEGVVAVDSAERVLLMNAAAARLLGLDQALSVDAELWRSVRFPDLEAALRGALAGVPVWHGDAPSPVIDGRVLSLSATRVEPDIGAVALLADVTELRRLDKVRIDFVANVSHEMRTPLAAILGALETVEDETTERADVVRFLDIASRNAMRMKAIVADLLDLSRIESEGDRMAMSELPLEAPVRTAMRALAGTAESKGVTLGYTDPPHRPFIVTANEKRLEQVFTNLIENAIKYTPTGGEVKVRYLASSDEVTVEVSDSGIGMPADALPRIFERFYRVDKSRSREMGGTGLGLAIVKHCVRAHSGSVTVRSEEGTGTTFAVTIPIGAGK